MLRLESHRTLVLTATLLLAAPAVSSGQTFVSITSASNPVVHDLAETGGGSWEDVNGDGLLDLFVALGNLSIQNDALYLNLGGGAFQKVATGPVVTSGGPSIGGCFGDWDSDGLPDLFVTNRNFAGNFLFHALGDTVFAAAAGTDPVTDIGNSNSASWVDVDGDGDLDLYVINFQGDDYFYLNAGPPTWTLTRTPLATIGIGPQFSIHGVWADFDHDGDPDLFIGNAGSENDELFINQGGLAFARREIPDGLASLGASWGDYDDDGDLDLFVANYLNQPSILYRNEGGPSWNLVPMPTSVFPNYAASAVGSAWGDVDNDGDLDLVVAADNGQNEALFRNEGPPGYAFTRIAGALTAGGNSFGCALADMDRDGDLDLFVANRSNQNDFLFRNDGPTGHGLTVRCRGTVSNRSAIGARVRVLATIGGAPRWMTREVTALTGYNSQNPEQHFGLGDAAYADSVVVEWPSGLREAIAQVAPNPLLELVEGALVSVPGAPRAESGLGLRLLGANPVRAAVALAVQVPEGRTGEVALVDAQGRLRARSGPLPPGSSRLELPGTATLRPGVYWVRLASGAETRVTRIVRIER